MQVWEDLECRGAGLQCAVDCHLVLSARISQLCCASEGLRSQVGNTRAWRVREAQMQMHQPAAGSRLSAPGPPHTLQCSAGLGGRQMQRRWLAPSRRKRKKRISHRISHRAVCTNSFITGCNALQVREDVGCRGAGQQRAAEEAGRGQERGRQQRAGCPGDLRLHGKRRPPGAQVLRGRQLGLHRPQVLQQLGSLSCHLHFSRARCELAVSNPGRKGPAEDMSPSATLVRQVPEQPCNNAMHA